MASLRFADVQDRPTEFFTFQLRRNKARYLKGTFPHSPRLEPDLPL